SPNGSLDALALTVHKAPRATAVNPAYNQRFRRRGGGSAMSRIARMMFSRLTRTLIATIVPTATTKPITNDCAKLAGLTVKYRSNWLCSELNADCDQATSTRPR